MDDNLSDECNEPSGALYLELARQLTEGRRHRERHFYICTESGVGKTVLLTQLERRLRVFYMPSKHPLEGYEDGKYDIMVYEEFAPGSAQLSLMNNITGGGTTNCGSTRYNATSKSDEIPIIIMTNYMPHEVYPNCVGNRPYNAFLSRFRFIRFTRDQPIRLFLDPEDAFNDLDEEDYELPSWVQTVPEWRPTGMRPPFNE